jgi:hypothetical protein
MLASAAALQAGAEPIPEEYLTAEYENCMQQAAAASYTETQRQGYCSCSRDEFAKLSFEQYLKLNGEVLENQLSAETAQYLESVHATCASNLAQ